jgi:prepilin-type N-terminal cleavage/methylation domain-containing protein
MKNKLARRHGFTIIETMIVIAIVGIIMADSTGMYAKTATDTIRYYYNGADVSHNIQPALGQVFIAVGHYCLGDGRSIPGDGPLAGPDSDFTRIAVLIGLEKGGSFCIDNNGT